MQQKNLSKRWQLSAGYDKIFPVMKKAAFLDRDGTINEDIGHLFSEEKLVFIPKAVEALRILQQEEYLLYIITNQPGIEQGAFTETECADFSRRYEKILRDRGITVEKTFFCPHMKKTGCGCIKPQTFFIDKILEEEDIDLSASFAAGDHPHDVEMGKRAGVRTVYLLTGHGRHHLDELQALEPDITAENLYEAAIRLTGRSPR